MTTPPTAAAFIRPPRFAAAEARFLVEGLDAQLRIGAFHFSHGYSFRRG
jgi:hypothetical protein